MRSLPHICIHSSTSYNVRNVWLFGRSNIFGVSWYSMQIITKPIYEEKNSNSMPFMLHAKYCNNSKCDCRRPDCSATFLFIHIPNICHTESENEFQTLSSISISDRKSWIKFQSVLYFRIVTLCFWMLSNVVSYALDRTVYLDKINEFRALWYVARVFKHEPIGH